MNSAAKRGNGRPRLALLALAASGAFGILAGCADHGPTNLYSNPLFGQTQAGATMQLWSAYEHSLTPTAADQYVISIKNTGAGSVIGPITAQVTLASSGLCAGTTLESYSGTPITPPSAQTVVFGTAGQAIAPGQVLTGYASSPAWGGYRAYSAQVGFPLASPDCVDATTNFNVSLTDGKGDAWTVTFSGTND